MEEAADLANYLPLSFETNYTHGKYQFAFLAYHNRAISRR